MPTIREKEKGHIQFLPKSRPLQETQPLFSTAD